MGSSPTPPLRFLLNDQVIGPQLPMATIMRGKLSERTAISLAEAIMSIIELLCPLLRYYGTLFFGGAGGDDDQLTATSLRKTTS